ncbi:MAG: TlpA family protein disulfide reductase [Gammaproteobacteria bacterium]|nr:TlpA family protein disulfide reductase [Gammaproteobacteria bacterium]MYC24946.1 TlpA family protein disulfide reductase [Gammaproteobacteria bacterium]
MVNNEEDSDVDAEDTTEIDAVELVDAVEPAEGCEDAVAQEEEEAEPVAQTPEFSYPKWYTLRMEAVAFQNEKLQDIAKNHKDPNAQLLAMQMGVFSPYENAEEAIAVWQALAEKFDADFVATYITPELERIELVHTRTLNNEALVPGQKVPAFTLANLDGDDVSLYDLAGTKDMVLIDFWASWCGPCIATFPELKKLHAAYTDENFEIVGVSVDDNLEDWSGGVEDHQLPWVQLGELKDADNGSPVSVSYGINFIPSTFLIDSQGCIYRKNIHTSELKDFLVDRYGMDESLVEPEEEPEETPEISS